VTPQQEITMKSIITLHATPNAWITNSVLAPHLDAFIAHLQRGRYAAETTRGYLRGIAHFAYWMTQNNLPVQALDERTVEQFLIGHLPRCDYPRPVMRTYRDLRATLGHLLRVLRQQGVISEPSASSNYIAEELYRYDQYMFKTRGLSAGTVTLRHTKSHRQDILPLPAVTGEVLADYICHERPKTTNPAVFVRCLAPHDKPISAHAIQRLIRDAYRRIGLKHGRTHALRHTLACRLIDHGSSLKEVADVLRHRSLNTTLIYAKLDNRRLVAVALSWPGSTT
jgi:site-specific recombinase XerD